MTKQASHWAARLLRLPRTLFEYLILYFGLLLLGSMLLGGTVICLIVVLCSPPHRRRSRARAAVSSVFRYFLNIMGALGLIRTDLGEIDRLRNQGALVVAPNHPSLLDAMLMLSRMPNASCIMKSSLMRNVFLAKGAQMAGYIENDAARSMVRQAVQRLDEGGQLLVFPEGTRTISEPVNPLKGAFSLIAKKSGKPVQIVIIETNSPYLRKGWPLWKRPDLPLYYRARLGPQFEPTGTTDEIKLRTQKIFERELARYPAKVSRPYPDTDTDSPIDA